MNSNSELSQGLYNKGLAGSNKSTPGHSAIGTLMLSAGPAGPAMS